MLDCKDPLSGTIAPNTHAEANKEVKLATAGQKKEWGLYCIAVEVLVGPKSSYCKNIGRFKFGGSVRDCHRCT